jgi:hypothetical protein
MGVISHPTFKKYDNIFRVMIERVDLLDSSILQVFEDELGYAYTSVKVSK